MPNLWDARFDRLHACQTRQLGIDIRATITGYCSNAKAILGSINNNSMVFGGGLAEVGGYEIQIKVSDLPVQPVKQSSATVNGAANGLALEVSDSQNQGGVYVIQLADFASKN